MRAAQIQDRTHSECHSGQHQHYTSSASVQRVSENKGSACRESISVMLQMPPVGGWTGARWSWSTGHGAHCHTLGHTGRVMTFFRSFSSLDLADAFLLHCLKYFTRWHVISLRVCQRQALFQWVQVCVYCTPTSS